METLQRTANRGSISTGFDIDNSLKLENDNAEQLYYTPSSAGNLKTWTYSCWIKRTELSYNMMLFGANDTYAYFVSDDTLLLRFTGTNNFRTARVFRDTSAWTHIVVAVDTTQATTADRIKIYFNGEDQTGLFASDTFPAQNTNTSWNNTLVHYVAGWGTASFNPSCYLAEVYNIDGQKLAATDFGEFDEDTGIWKPKAYTGSYGTNGYHLDFENASDLGTVAAGTQHSFVKSNITSADQATDTPTNNFCIANANAITTSNLHSFVEGGTVLKRITADQWDFFTTTMPVNSGKWYAEFEPGAGPVMIGIGSLSYFEGTSQASLTGAGLATNSGVAYYGADGKRWVDNTEAAYGSTFTSGDIISIALDCDNNYVYFAKNGTWQNSGDPTSGATGTGALATDPSGDYFVMTINALYNPTTHKMNYGGYTTISIASGNSDANGYGNFEYAPPSGYYALCSKNLAEFG